MEKDVPCFCNHIVCFLKSPHPYTWGKKHTRLNFRLGPFLYALSVKQDIV